MADRGRVGSLVVGCKSAAQKEWRRQHEGHRERIKSVQPTTDMTAPITMGMNHFRTNLKRERQLEERYMEIDRENAVMLKKMSDALKKPNPYVLKPDTEKPPSLNRQQRKFDLIRITQENHRMLRAIQKTKPVYDVRRWEDNFKKTEVILKNCCAYPVVTRLPRNTSAPSVLMTIESEAPATAAGGSRTSTPKSGREDDRRHVLKEGKRIGDKYYLLEFTTDGRALTISAYDGDSQTTLELVVKEKRHRQLYRELNGDYSLLASKLRVEKDRLLLD
mmetsp:Transcript_58028/g.123263  ORF Transcript_58028/g.123263 Transcript_58028/m.123263 type:complete len:276 (+) Transcript_58028:117-944(+)|eukprot:CAMPEP_0206427118 /NCGR_PEP_ID=MMETSP0324_2-20121206/4831_1 /ASSEMBLY_ACC=CAM_ASM_000836 /TAXON_ID=2866 /ORGANISM="Crypthecodinium cohnii, Strain Seligo" /LENGTH=275 /DNA_ID=CAMNT_0053892299 /DNA_START=107 /DNA_END=934 /DNA_ORIENTATION=+